MSTDAQYSDFLPAFGRKAMYRRLGVSAGLEGRCLQRSGSRKRLLSNKRDIAQHGTAKCSISILLVSLAESWRGRDGAPERSLALASRCGQSTGILY
jgi:hypothetical protein